MTFATVYSHLLLAQSLDKHVKVSCPVYYCRLADLKAITIDPTVILTETGWSPHLSSTRLQPRIPKQVNKTHLCFMSLGVAGKELTPPGRLLLDSSPCWAHRQAQTSRKQIWTVVQSSYHPRTQITRAKSGSAPPRGRGTNKAAKLTIM